MPWNVQQKAIFRAARKGENLVLDCDAGTGKSTIALAIAKKKNKKGLMLSFNQDMKLDNIRKAEALGLCNKQGYGLLTIRTFHGWGYSMFPRNMKVQIKPWRLEEYCRNAYPNDWEFKNKLIFILKQFRERGFLRIDEESISKELREQTIIRLGPDLVSFWQSRVKVIAKCLADLDVVGKEIDFSDMCRMPIRQGWATGAAQDFEVLFVDEIQDLNNDQHVMLMMALEGANCQVIAAGDEKQSIYSFRGANNSMATMKEIVGGQILPLNTTFRCHSEIVEFVNEHIPTSEMVALRQGGEVERLIVEEEDEDIYAVTTLLDRKVDMVISSRNSTLISVWIGLFKENYDSDLKGSKVVTALREMVNSIRTWDWNTFIREITLKAHAGKKNKFLDQHADIAKALLLVVKDLNIRNRNELGDYLDAMEGKISNKRAESIIKELVPSGIKLETVHSSKGREAPRVAVISDWFESKDDPVENLKYVAWSRAISYLLVIKPGKAK